MIVSIFEYIFIIIVFVIVLKHLPQKYSEILYVKNMIRNIVVWTTNISINLLPPLHLQLNHATLQVRTLVAKPFYAYWSYNNNFYQLL